MPPLPEGVREHYESNFQPRRSTGLNPAASPREDGSATRSQPATATASTCGPVSHASSSNTSTPQSFAYETESASSESGNLDKNNELSTTGYPVQPNSGRRIYGRPPSPVERPTNPLAKYYQDTPPSSRYISPYPPVPSRPTIPPNQMPQRPNVMAGAPFEPPPFHSDHPKEEDVEDDDSAPIVYLEGFPLEMGYEHYDKLIQLASTGYWFKEYKVVPRTKTMATRIGRTTGNGGEQKEYGEKAQNENTLEVYRNTDPLLSLLRRRRENQRQGRR